MGDFFDEEEDPNYSKRERLQNQLFAMQEMLEQLNEAKSTKEDAGDNSQNRGFGPDSSRERWRGGGGRGFAERGGRGRGFAERGGRGGFVERGGRRGTGGRGGRRGRQGRHSPQFNSENYREPGGMGYGDRRSFVSPNRGRNHPTDFNRQRRDNFGDDQQSPRQHSDRQIIRPQFLVETLADYPDYSCSLLQLLEQKNMQPAAVREVATNYPKIFSLMNEIVELKPQIKICTHHCGEEGCLNPSCDELHICDQYVLDRCQERNCVLGHKWRTGHNDPILHNFYIKQLPFPTLLRLLQKTRTCKNKTQLLDLCLDYNEKGCEERNCASLHLCMSFISGLTKCKNKGCKLNHDPLEHSCQQLLEQHGFATNESPRDIIVALVTSNPSIKKEKTQKEPPKQRSKVSSKLPKNEAYSEDSNDSDQEERLSKSSGKKKKSYKKDESCSSQSSSSDNSVSESENDAQSSNSDDNEYAGKYVKQRNPPKKSPAKVRTPKLSEVAKEPSAVKKIEIHRTLWSHYLQGDVPIPEICYYSVESSCRNEGSGCQRLHATKHFHWQVCDQNNRWLNLRPEQVECLEYAYCDPNNDNVELPRLDPATLEPSVSGLFILMGRETWISDFKTIINASKAKAYKVRRVCTQLIDGEEIKPSLCFWYFSDKNGQWVQYGNVDTAGATHLVSSITSDDIEKQFLMNPTSTLPFSNSKFTYVLDFKTMTQMNINTRVARKVLRRPVPHIQEERLEEEAQKATSDLPDTWDKMLPAERMRLVPLPPSSSEYQTVVGLLQGKMSNSNVMKVQRIQNPFLWRALENKINEMATIYKDEAQVNVQQLFHGTDSGVVSNICAENFDWRLHGSKTGQAYGAGTYFATEASTSYGYTRPDANNMRYMFIARVAVGSITLGSSGMARPPINPQTLQPFDSTVNSVPNPGIIVKYDKQEYYPEYLLTLS